MEQLKKLLQNRLVRFLIVGASNTVFTFAIYEGLLFFLTYGLAFTISFIAGLIFTSLLNVRIVFSAQLTARTIACFAAYYCFYYLLNLATLWLVIESTGVPAALAPLVTLPLLTPVNYLCSKYVVAQGDLWRPRESHRR
jgi:putative flippase GtrA